MDSDICTWSDTVADIHDVPYGYAPPLQESINFYAPEWQEKIKQTFSTCAKEGIPYDGEMEIITRKGRRVWVRTTGKAVKNQKDKIIKVHGSFQDITDKKHTEKVLRESEEMMRSSQSVAHICSYSTNLNINKIEKSSWVCSPEFYNIFGIDESYPHTIAGWANCIHPDYREEVFDYYKSVVKERKPFSLDYKIIRFNDGAERWVHSTGKLEFDDQGNPVIMHGAIQDITKRKRAEEALQESEAAFKQQNGIFNVLLNNLSSGVFMVEAPSGRPIIANMAAQRLLGRGILPDASEQNLAEVYHAHKTGTSDPYPLAEMPIVRGMYGETAHIDDLIVTRPDGVETWLEVFGAPIRNAQGDVWASLVSFQDITERKQAEAEKEKLEAQLSQAQKMEAIGQLAGGVAHDFNNMLGVILGHTEMALEKIDPAEPLFAGLRAVQQAAERSVALTRQLLAFARKQTIAPIVINLNDTVAGMLKMLHRLIGENIDLLWKPGGNHYPVKVDPSQIDQILANLCVNARDAIAGVGKITIETNVISFDEAYCAEHARYKPGEYILLAVSDDGCGMDRETLDHIFEPFFTTKEQGKGTGLGLASVYGAVKQNNGFINVYSEPGQGTTVRIYLPKYTAKPANVSEEAPDHPAEPGHETILLVEDEPAILEMTTMLLGRLGYTVVAASTPGEAIRLAHENSGRISLLMTDVVMPEMNGRELAGNLLNRYPGLKRLFMSGYTANVIAHHGVLDEGVHFIQKPFSKKELGAKLREALEG